MIPTTPRSRRGSLSGGLGGTVATASAQDSNFDFPRLERAVESLLAAHEQLRGENDALRAELAARDERVGDLESALRDQQQRRADAIVRIDALVEQLVELDARLERAEETRPAGAEVSVGAAT